jgi:AcrR family transcriptional regulator
MVNELDSESPPAPARGRGRISRDQRRDLLLDVAAELVLSDSPDGVTMELVAERCGVSRPLVYKHFANREELLGALYRREARRLDAELAGEVGAAATVFDMYRTLVRGALRATAERGHLFSVLRQRSGMGSEVRREQRSRDDRTFRAFARRAVEELGADPRLTPVTTSLLLSLIDPVLAQWRLDPTPEHAALLEESYLHIVTASLRDLEGGRRST